MFIASPYIAVLVSFISPGGEKDPEEDCINLDYSG
jgi:hypothetical protein